MSERQCKRGSEGGRGGSRRGRGRASRRVRGGSEGAGRKDVEEGEKRVTLEGEGRNGCKEKRYKTHEGREGHTNLPCQMRPGS